MAQALGDLEVLAARGRRVIRLHLESGAGAGLERVASLFDSRHHGMRRPTRPEAAMGGLAARGETPRCTPRPEGASETAEAPA